MLRGIWQSVKERIYDTVNSLFRTQAEIDDVIEDDFADEGYTTLFDPSQLPADGKWRAREFYFPEDVKKYISDAGIPPSCVFIVEFPDWTEYGDTMYKLYILENTP